MRKLSKVIFHMNTDEAEKILSPLGFSAICGRRMQVAESYMDTAQYNDLIAILNKYAIEYTEYIEEVFSEQEIESAELLRMIPNAYCGYPLPDLDGGYVEVSYDVQSGCPHCEQGKLQNAPLRIKAPKMGRNDIAGLHWIYEYVITQRLKEFTKQAQLTGCEFWSIIDHRKNVERTEVCQLFIANIMPPISPKTNIERAPGIKPCECGKKGYYNRGLFIYDKSALIGIKDFNKTYEWLGGGESTWQLPIVTQRVNTLFKKNKIKGVRFEPVKVI